ncbi:MAG: response regulator [Bacteroidetes bacterium]|jgi:CheY-like chemotaxis protein|nr:response regulator [Bacteroidota bacterium]MDP4587562.1 response regulator [Flavobacteriales bacterium]
MSKELHIILVDDNDIDIVVNSKLLKLANFSQNISSFNSGRDVLDFLEDSESQITDKQNILLLDIQMPIMGGFECLDKIMELPAEVQESLMVFMLSSSIDRNDIERAEKNPAVLKVLEKPLDVYLLKRLVEANA